MLFWVRKGKKGKCCCTSWENDRKPSPEVLPSLRDKPRELLCLLSAPHSTTKQQTAFAVPPLPPLARGCYHPTSSTSTASSHLAGRTRTRGLLTHPFGLQSLHCRPVTGHLLSSQVHAISSDKPALASSTELHLLLHFSVHLKGHFFQEPFSSCPVIHEVLCCILTELQLLGRGSEIPYVTVSVCTYWVTPAGVCVWDSVCCCVGVYLLSHSCWGLSLSFYMLQSQLCIAFAFLCASLAHRGKVWILYNLPVCIMLLNTGKETATEIIFWLFSQPNASK